MRNVPSEFDEWYTEENYQNDLIDILAEPWQVELLEMNPQYTGWGIDEGYMTTKGDGWGTSEEYLSWDDFSSFDVDKLNEVVNFYFELSRDSKECPDCKHGYSPRAWELKSSFYDNSDNSWKNNLSQEVVDILWKENNIPHNFKKKPLAEEVNDWSKNTPPFTSLNDWAVVRSQCEVEGVSISCATCGGEGRLFTGEKCDVSLSIWVLHPRKSSSRGWKINNITEADLPEIFALLRHARDRNAERFARIPN